MLVVARHGRTTANAGGRLVGRIDPDLDDIGRAQAGALGAALAGGVDRIVSSPLRRAISTARAISGGAVEIEVDDRLIELDYGSLDGLVMADIDAKTWSTWRGDINWRPPGGESLVELDVRVREALDDLVGAAAVAEVVVVTHALPMKSVAGWARNAAADWWGRRVDTAAVSRVAVDSDGRMDLVSFNDTAHLAGIEPSR